MAVFIPGVEKKLGVLLNDEVYIETKFIALLQCYIT